MEKLKDRLPEEKSGFEFERSTHLSKKDIAGSSIHLKTNEIQSVQKNKLESTTLTFDSSVSINQNLVLYDQKFSHKIPKSKSAHLDYIKQKVFPKKIKLYSSIFSTDSKN